MREGYYLSWRDEDLVYSVDQSGEVTVAAAAEPDDDLRAVGRRVYELAGMLDKAERQVAVFSDQIHNWSNDLNRILRSAGIIPGGGKNKMEEYISGLRDYFASFNETATAPPEEKGST